MKLELDSVHAHWSLVTMHALLIISVAQICSLGSGQQPLVRLPLGSILQANQTLVSWNGTFALGFFSLGTHRNYLGIRYNKLIPNDTHIWMANRNAPAKDGAFLEFSKEGDLIIFNPDGTAVWKSGTGGMKITSTVLEETGNLLLSNGIGKSIWQSFNHPTDTWVPGMKMYVGYNLTSSISMVDVANGRFSLQVLPSTEFVSVWNRTTHYWTTGVWTGSGFADVPDMSPHGHFATFEVVDDHGSAKPLYYLWKTKDGLNIQQRFTMEYDGSIRVRIWDSTTENWDVIWQEPRDPCQVDHICGVNGICNSDCIPFCSCPQWFKPADPTGWSNGDWSQGCAADIRIDCSIKSFFALNNTSYDQGSAVPSTTSESGQGEDWCQAQCMKDCSCLGFTYSTVTGNCSLQQGPLINGRTSPDMSQVFFIRSTPNTQLSVPNGRNKTRKAWIIALPVAAGALIIILISNFLIWLRLRNERVADTESYSSSRYLPGVSRKFSYKELRTATKDFSEALGSGGFGTVYKGVLRNQIIVGVKKLHNVKKKTDKNFRAEVSTLGRIQHVNLVRLRGYCVEVDHRLLVHDYMPHGSLDKLLFSSHAGDQTRPSLDWKMRFSIAVGTARGISYLHEECSSCIIHCDIKPENILLDDDFVAKVSDFGLAKLMGREISRVLTSMRGTRGYLAPEWLSNLPITAKADVYSYGMTLFEIISGRRNAYSFENSYFPALAYRRAQMEDFSSLADSKLRGDLEEGELKRAVLVALWCIQDEESSRPSMAKVVQMLEGNVHIFPPPQPISLLILDLEMNPLSVSLPESESVQVQSPTTERVEKLDQYFESKIDTSIDT